MPRKLDLTGQVFGRLLCVDRADNIGRETAWNCKCDCGRRVVVKTTSLRTGNTRSCGCLFHEHISNLNKKHGLAGGTGRRSRIFRIWCGMRRRCEDPAHTGYSDYGGRGIRVHDEWSDFARFHGWALDNGYRDDLTLDRIDNDGDYEPSNCRWASRKTQNRNSRHNRIITFGGKAMTLAEWSEETGIPYDVIRRRLNQAWPLSAALTAAKGSKLREFQEMEATN